MKLKNYTTAKILICDWTGEKNFLIHYRMLNFYVRHGMIVDKIHEKILFQQNKWLEKHISFNTQRRNPAKHDFEKDFCKLLNNAFYGRTMEKVRKLNKIGIIQKI